MTIAEYSFVLAKAYFYTYRIYLIQTSIRPKPKAEWSQINAVLCSSNHIADIDSRLLHRRKCLATPLWVSPLITIAECRFVLAKAYFCVMSYHFIADRYSTKTQSRMVTNKCCAVQLKPHCRYWFPTFTPPYVFSHTVVSVPTHDNCWMSIRFGKSIFLCHVLSFYCR